MKVLISGCGYLGSVLVNRLMSDIRNPKSNGVENVVHVIDNLHYGCSSIVSHLDKPYFKLFKGSILDEGFLIKVFKQTKYDCVVHLASLVGEPLCEAHPELAREVNVEGTRRLLSASSFARVPLFIYSNTCSVYGITGETVSEDSQTNQTGLYAETKLEAERSVSRYPFSYISFRNATLYGLSPRMRFDIIPNQWVKDAYLGRPLKVYDPDGLRPFLHIQDCVEYFVRAINTPQTMLRRQIFNVGDCNVTKMELALTVKEFFPKTKIDIVANGDKRSYSVDFSKVQGEFNYVPKINLYDGIGRLSKSLSCLGDLDNSIYDNLRGFRK